MPAIILNDCLDPLTWTVPVGDGSSGTPCVADVDCIVGEACSASHRCLLTTNAYMNIAIDAVTDAPTGLSGSIQVQNPLAELWVLFAFAYNIGNVDFTLNPILDFWVKVSDATKPLRFNITQVNPWRESPYTIPGLVSNQWQQFLVDLRNPDDNGVLPDLANIFRPRFDFEAQLTNAILQVAEIKANPITCSVDADCPTGYVCQNNECVPITQECTTDQDCGYGQICVGGVCVDHAPCGPGTVWDESQKACVPKKGGILGWWNSLPWWQKALLLTTGGASIVGVVYTASRRKKKKS